MAKQTWNTPIDKSVDWGGDDNTGGLPVSGEMIQKFIKESLDGKAGLFYYDAANNRYLVFGDESLKDEYLADPTKTELIIGSFDAPFNYSAEITLATPTYNSVMYGSRGNYLEFTFDIKNKSGASTGENAIVTYTFIRNSVKQVVTEKKRCGDAVRFNIDNYLGEGTNTVIIGVMGQTSLAATTVSLTYQVVNLVLSDNYDISRTYDLSTGSKTAEVSYTISGYGTKIMEWYLDGVKLPFVKSEDEIVDVLATKTKYITLANLQQGVHSLQFRAYTSVDGETFYTEAFYRDLIVYTGANSSPIIAVAVNLPKDRGILGADDPISLYGLSQYVPYTLRFATYSPTNAASTSVTIAIDGAPQGTVQSSNGNENRFTFTPSSGGNKTITLTAGSTTYSLPAVISGSSIDVEDIEDSLVINFDASQKSNNSSDRETWTDGTYTGTLAGFNFNNASGWVNGRLEMNAGASFSIDLSPLAGSPTTTGKTIELEWSTKNVIDDNEIICDLRTNGTGILITATKVSLVSDNGVVIETEYKSEENVRVGFVINKATGTSNQHMSFIYTNGIVSRCETWAVADSYTSSAQLVFNSSAKVQVSLKQIRVYDMALSSDQMLNNYTIYRDTVAEMMEIYDRNDVYISGTATFSPDKMMSRLPVMIVTGDIPTLENTSDKDTQIIVDIEYTNLQDPTRSFTMKNAAMRPQGTSSMGYPKKNFRIYTRKNDGTILYDSNGREVKNKLYAFKAGSQPVDCWCLKADYAESSGTHNTGIARLWNKALYDARVTHTFGDNDERNINDATVLRTNAQRVAAENGYPYDVRTTIDGFPILLFYRQNANEELIFIGKYNFNNDKSNESVFGFKGIPNFDNSKMQCWEVLNNGNALALFTTVSGFDSGWKEAFEARYPDKSTDVADLKAFCTWMVNVSQSAFATEKWEHLDVYKMAAYWVYLMRHAAADQFVKNAMFTSEDGQKWYYILYDNDTINGLINTGRLRIRPEDGRQTVDATGSYVFAGHDSRLWNMLEADQEFMQIVSSVDNALYSAGISYINTIKIFDEEQADKWVERVYNQDAQYKYIGPYVDNGINNLFMLQGKRDLHRKWWLAKRFSIYDAKYVSGTYKSKSVEIKCINGTPAGQQFTIKAGDALDYGYGINNVPRSFGITLEAGASHTFTTSEVVNLGDPIRIYGAPHIEEIDFSQMASKLAVVTVANAYDEALGTMLKKLIVGKSGVTNAEVTEISGLKQLAKLEELDVQGMTKMTSIDLTSQKNLKTLKAKGSNIASATFAKGAPVERLEFPSTMKVLTLEQLPYLTSENVVVDGNMAGIHTIDVKGCPELSNDFAWVKNWYDNKTTDNAQCSLTMDEVNWEGLSPDDLFNLTNLGTLSLKGKAVIDSITLEQITAFREVFGENVFEEGSEFYIDAPAVVVVTGRTELLEGEQEQYEVVVVGGKLITTEWSIQSGSYAQINADGLLTTTEYGYGRTVVVRAVVVTDSGSKIMDTSVSVKARKYPTSSETSIVGSANIESATETYNLVFSTQGITGEMSATWTLTGFDDYAEIESSDDTSCVIKRLQETNGVLSGTLSCKLTKKSTGATLFTATKTLGMRNENIAETDAGICKALYDAGLCADPTFITKEEAANITAEQLQPGTTVNTSIFYAQRTNIKSFDGFKWFTRVTKVPAYCFQYAYMTSIEIPRSVVSLGTYCFANSSLSSITIPDSVITLEKRCLAGMSKLKQISLPTSITTLPEECFYDCSLTSITIPSSVTSVGKRCFYRSGSLVSVVFSEGVTSIGNECFVECYSLESVVIPSTMKSLPYKCFENCTKLNQINLPEGLTTLGQYCFYYCSALENITLPSTLTGKIDTRTFYGCSKLKEIDIPEGITSIYESAFYSCGALERAVLPSTLTFLSSSAFEWCSKLKSINIPEGVTKISDKVFAGCNSLESLYLPSTVTSFVGNAYYSNSEEGAKLHIDVHPLNAYYSSEDGVLFNKDKTEIVCFRKDGEQHSYVIPETVNKISAYAFYICKRLDAITIPNGVTSIGQSAFYFCKSLESITIPSSVTEIGSKCFDTCTKLTSITFLSAVAPTLYDSKVFGESTSNCAGSEGRLTGENTLFIPAGATGYDGTNWTMYLLNPAIANFKTEILYTPTECTSLTITADDVSWRATKTTIHYVAMTNGVDPVSGGTINGVEITGDVESESFPQNTSTTETVTRTISFTYLGVTATTTITQSVWVDSGYTVNLNSQWELSTTIANPDSVTYDGVYQSFSNKGVNNGLATMYIDIRNYETFKLYIRSYAESTYDYVMVGELDTEPTASSNKANTKGNQSPGTAISNYTLVEYTNIGGGEHRITIIYRKDNGGNTADDRGYVLIPKEQ